MVEVLNGHTFGPYHYAGMGNTERECSRCHFRQDEQVADENVPPCQAGAQSLLPCVKVEDALARMVELGVPESALTPIRQWVEESRASAPEHAERCRLTRWLHDRDWDMSDRADVQDYLEERLATLGGPVPIAEAWGDS